MNTSFRWILFLFAVAALVATLRAPAASITNAQSGNFADGSTWQGGVAPGAADTVYFRNGGSSRTVTWTANSSATAFDIGGASATNVFDLAGYTNTLSGFFNDGIVSGAGSMLSILSSGVTATAGLKIGTLGNGQDTLMLSNGAVYTTSAAITMGGAGRDFNVLNVLPGTRFVDSSGGQFTLGNFSKGNTVIVGGVFTNTGTFQFSLGAGDNSNTVVVAGPNAIWSTSGGMTMGASASAEVGDALTVSNGGSAYVGGNLAVGRGISSTNFSVVVAGSNSVFTAGSLLRVNGIGSTIMVTNGGRMTLLNDAVVGYSTPGTSNVVVATGTGTLLDASVTSKGLRVGSNSFGLGNGYVYIRDGATLRTDQIQAGSNSTGFVQNDGGIYEFSSTAPAVDLSGTAGSVTLNNGTISARNVSGFFVDRQITNITYSGNNTLRLDGSTNASVASYNFASGGAFSRLQLANTNALWQGTVLNVGSGGALLASNAVGAAVSGTVTNSGVVTVYKSTLNFKGNVVSSGGIVTDPSTVTYEQNLTLLPDGYINATNDTFVFYKNFVNQSTNQPMFNLAQATVQFVSNGGTTAHTYDVSGSGSLNIGQGYTNFSQVAGDFALGTLLVQAGNRLTITGTVGAITNAVYVGWLDLQGAVTNTYSDATNSLVLALNLPNINLYYDKFDPRNDWLNANLTGPSAAGYQLWGPAGGMLLPIPEPSVLALALGGVAMGVALARRRHAARG